MAKDKTKTGVANKHLHARISYLQQAATYLATSSAGRPGPIATAQREMDDKGSSIPGTASEACEETAPDAARQDNHNERDTKKINFEHPSFGGLPLQLSSHLMQVARKSQIRLHPNVKHSICKRCATPLIEGQTCTKDIENLSKGAGRPHADILILSCNACGATKRFPVGAKRQQRKTKRAQNTKPST